MMKEKVLFVDYIYQKGHVNFNRIHIDALKAAGYDVRLVLHEDVARQLDYSPEEYDLTIPHVLNQRDNSPVLNRIIFVVTLFLIRLRVKLGGYSRVVVSCCDEVTLGLFPLCRNMYVMCHNTATVTSRVKLFFLRRLARHNTFLVFDEYMRKPLIENGISKVKVVSHGCVPPFDAADDSQLPDVAKGFSHLVFHPSSKTDTAFVDSLVADNLLARFLKENGVLLLVHGDGSKYDALPDNIRFVSGYLPMSTYRSVFMRAEIILLAYPETFQNQVSGVSFECVANRKRILVREHPALAYCRDFYNYDPIFSSVRELTEKIGELVASPELRCVASRETLTPDYVKIFE